MAVVGEDNGRARARAGQYEEGDCSPLLVLKRGRERLAKRSLMPCTRSRARGRASGKRLGLPPPPSPLKSAE